MSDKKTYNYNKGSNPQRPPKPLWKGPESVGRFRREAYMLFVGEHQMDADECRNHFWPMNWLLPRIREFNPPITRAELMWVINLVSGFLPATRFKFFDELFEIVNDETT